jgi:hypothetical protein
MPHRLNAHQRGYDAKHKRIRAHYAPLVQAGRITCWRCGHKIQPTDTWDLGHDDNNRAIYRGPEHANQCNRAAAGRKSQAMRAQAHTPPKPDTTRQW